MLKASAAVCTRGSKARRINGDLQWAMRAYSLLEFSNGRSRTANSPKPTCFKRITEAFLRNHGTPKLGLCPHLSAHTSHFRGFCVHALNQQVHIHPHSLDAAQTKIPHEVAQCNELNDENDDADTTFQDACCKDEAALQAFDAMVDKIRGSGKDTDANSLQALEGFLVQMESSAITGNKQRIGAACSKLAELYSAAKEPAKSLLYAQKGFEVLRRIKDSSAKYEACRCLYVIATAHCSGGEFEKALKQAEHLDLILRHLEKSSRKKDFTSLKYALQTILIKCKMSLGQHEEALPHFHKYVKLKEKLVDRDDPSLGAVYIQTAQAFQEADHSAEAIHFALKALSIHTEKFGSSSYQVGYVRSLLSEAYYGVGLFEECLSEYDQARPILETVKGNSIETLAPFIMKSVSSLIELQRYELAVMRLEDLIRSTSKSCVAHASALVTLAKVYSLSNMRKQFLECCNKALNVLESNHKMSIITGEYICSLASAHEVQKHYEEAIVLYKKALAIFNRFSGDEAALKAADTEGEIGIALLRSEKFSQAAPYLKNYALKNKSIIGSDNTRLMAVHNRVGAEYLQVGRMTEALEQLETAKLLLPSDLTEIDDAIILSLNQNLATVYKVLGRFEEAVDCQRTALDTATNSNHEEIRSLTDEIQKSLEALPQRHYENTGKCEPQI